MSGGKVRTRRSLFVALGAQLIVRALGLAAGVVVAASLARGLGHVGFGEFSLVLTLVGVATNIGELGLTSTVVRQLAVCPDAQGEIVGALVLARIAAGALGAGLVMASVFALEQSPAVRLVGALGAATLLLAPLASLRAVGQAKLRIGAQNVLLLLQSGMWTVAVVVLALFGASLIAFGIAFFFTSAIYSVATWMFFRGLVPIAFRGAVPALADIVRISVPIVLGGLFVTSYYRIGGVLLYRHQGPDEVADYAAAYRFIDMLQVVPITLLGATLPLLASTWRADDSTMIRRRTRLFALALKTMMLAALPLAAGGALLASGLVQLVYGSEFAAAGPVLAVLMLSFPAICAGYIAVGLALASGRTILYCVVSAGAAAASVPANLLLIPVGGAIASAWITVCTEYAVSGVLLVVLRSGASVEFPLRALAGTVLAVAGMLLAVAPLRDGPIAVSVLVGAVAFAVGAVAFRAVTMEDLRMLTDRREQDWL
jgi:PST family polysaccharide transporter